MPLQGAPHGLAHLVLRDGLGQPTQLDGVVGHRDAVLVHAARHGLNVAAQLGGQQQQQQDGETARCISTNNVPKIYLHQGYQNCRRNFSIGFDEVPTVSWLFGFDGWLDLDREGAYILVL